MIRHSCRCPTSSGSSSRTSTARRWCTSTAASTKRTRATRPASRTKVATSRCGSPRATSRSRRPSTEDETQLMLRRMGINVGPGATPSSAATASDARRRRLHVRAARRADDAAAAHRDLRVPHVRVGRGVLAKTDLVAGDGEGAKLVSYVRADETPHVEYLKTVLSEMRDRTIVGDAGKKHDGTELIGAVWERALVRVARRAASARHQPDHRRARARAHVEPSTRRHPRSLSRSSGPQDSTERGPVMKFGIFYEHQLPRPWTDDSERVLIQNALEQVELADKLGIQYVWEVEHHFLEEYSHSSAPEIFLAARQPADEEHPPRSRHHPDRAELQPPRSHRRARRDARPRVERPRRLRLGRVVESRPSSAASRSTRWSSARCGSRASRSRSAA